MADHLKPFIVRLLSAKGRSSATSTVAGVGFLLSERHVLTCAHVVCSALGLPLTTPSAPTTTIQLALPATTNHTSVESHVIFWQAYHPNKSGDVAVLELATPVSLPEHRPKLCIVQDFWKHGFRAFGFPVDQPGGVWAYGVLLGRNSLGWVHLESEKTPGYRVQPGFSGGPVWDETIKAVVGIVAAAEKQPDVKAAFMIPFDLLGEVASVLNLPLVQPDEPDPPPGDQRYQRNRSAILRQVRLMCDQMENSLEDAVKARLGQPDEEEFHSIQMRWIRERREIRSPHVIKAFDYFEEVGLLILGEPGAGKTTTLRKLAEQLLDRAAHNKNKAIPILFSLSSWGRSGKFSFEQWLIEELYTRYDVQPETSEELLRRSDFIPLLDGLDEVRSDLINDCIDAINQFRPTMKSMVVCCRSTEYRQQPSQLDRHGLIELEKLRWEQVEDYLARGGGVLAPLATLLRQNEQLRALAQTPLMLNVMTLALLDEPDASVFLLSSDPLSLLFDRCVKELLKKSNDNVLGTKRQPRTMGMRIQHRLRSMISWQGTDEAKPSYDDNQTRYWLKCLAKNMKDHSETGTHFLIERLRPDWLPRGARWEYLLGLGLLMGFLLGVIAGFGRAIGFTIALCLILRLTHPLVWGACLVLSYAVQGEVRDWLGYPQESPSFALDLALSFGLLGGGVVVFYTWWQLRSKYASPTRSTKIAEKFRWSLAGMVRGFGIGLLLGTGAAWIQITPDLISGLISGNLPALDLTTLNWWAQVMTGYALAFGLPIGSIFAVVHGLTPVESNENVYPNQGIWTAGRTALIVWVTTAAVMGVLLFGFDDLTATLLNSDQLTPIIDLLGSLQEALINLIPSLIHHPWLSALAFGLALALGHGGFVWLRHWMLRRALDRAGVAPWDYIKFLNYVSRHRLLQPVGRAYQFVHPLLQDYFTGDLTNKSIQEVFYDRQDSAI